MKKHFLFLIVMLQFLIAESQTWCPPGATWVYYFKNEYFTKEVGFWQVENDGQDTIVTRICTRLKATRHGKAGYFSEYALMPWHTFYFTYVENNVVFISFGSPQFDTVVDFKANIGEGWYVPGWHSGCQHSQEKLIVTDTSHVVLNGHHLKRLRMNNTFDIIERIGPTKGFFTKFQCCYLDCWDSKGTFSCYTDSQIGTFTEPALGNCNLLSSNEISPQLHYAKIYPNPSAGKFALDIPAKSVIRILNLHGTLILKNEISHAGTVEIDLSLQPVGVYLVEIIGPEIRSYQKFQKL